MQRLLEWKQYQIADIHRQRQPDGGWRVTRTIRLPGPTFAINGDSSLQKACRSLRRLYRPRATFQQQNSAVSAGFHLAMPGKVASDSVGG